MLHHFGNGLHIENLFSYTPTFLAKDFYENQTQENNKVHKLSIVSNGIASMTITMKMIETFLVIVLLKVENVAKINLGQMC